jgi:hypothetical protein
MSEASAEKRIAECGKQMAIAAVPLYTVDGAVHPPTLVAALARMAGYFLFRSCEVDTGGAKPGDVVLSPKASERTPVLLRTCAAVLARLGHGLPATPPEPLIDAKTAPRESFLESQARLSAALVPLQVAHGLDDHQAARAAAVATAVTIHTVRKNVEPVAAFGVAAFAFTEGSRTVPAPD